MPPPPPPQHPKSPHLDPPPPTDPPGPPPPSPLLDPPPPMPPPIAPPRPPLQCPPPPPQGASGQQLVGGVVGVQNRGVALPGPPMYFFIFRPLSPETGYHFFEGSGSQKFVLRRLQALGRATSVRISSGAMVVQPTAGLEVGGSKPGWPAFVGAGAAIGGLGFE